MKTKKQISKRPQRRSHTKTRRTVLEVLAARLMRERGTKVKEIAAALQIPASSVSDICREASWSHVSDPSPVHLAKIEKLLTRGVK